MIFAEIGIILGMFSAGLFIIKSELDNKFYGKN